VPSWQVAALEQLAAQNRLSGVPTWVLALIAKEESGFEDAGAGINSSNYGGYFGLSANSVPPSVLLTNSQASFEQQAPVAAAIFAQGLKLSGGNYVGAENYYQTGKVGSTSGGAKLFAQFLGGGLTGGQVSSSAPSPSSASASGCAFGVGPFCIFSQAGLQRFYGALLMGAGGLVITVGLGLVVIGALAETKAGRVASKTFGAAGLGAVAGAAAAPGRAVGERRTRRAAATQQAQAESQRAAQQQASQAHQAALRRAQLRSARARARRAEEGVRTQRAITQGRADSADILQYEQTEGRTRRRTAVESRAAGRRLEAQNKRSVAQRQKFIDVFGETG
jgi:hypothetical protein